jgi:copper transport protein
VKVAWPPRPEGHRLAAAVAEMRKVEHFTLHEQVTSDTATGLGPRMRIRLTGEEYLAAGPFGSGRAATVTRYQVHRGGEVTLALGYPAESVYVLLTVDRQNRIVREVLTSGEHLVTRTLVYDEPHSREGHQHESG